MEAVHETTGLPSGRESFCREGAKRFGWRAVCVTLGSNGCALLSGDEYVEAEGQSVVVADSVGAGDAFEAAFLHGLISQWPAREIAEFANRVGALVASRRGAIPDWHPQGLVEREAAVLRNQVQLIAYVDRLSGGGFRELQQLLDGPFEGLFGGVHLLPFFWPIDGADAGFDPIDHTQVDARLGSWDDVRAMAERRS